MSIDLEAVRSSYSGPNWRNSIDPDIQVTIGVLNLLPGCVTVCSCSCSGRAMKRIGDRFVPTTHIPSHLPYISIVCLDPMSAFVLSMALAGLPVMVQFGEGYAGFYEEKVDKLMLIYFLDSGALKDFSRNLWSTAKPLIQNNFLNFITEPVKDVLDALSKANEEPREQASEDRPRQGT